MDLLSLVATVLVILVTFVVFKQVTKKSPQLKKPSTGSSSKDKATAASNLKNKKNESQSSHEEANHEDQSKTALSIFFGSQSGTAETFAKELATEAKSKGFRAKVHDLEKYKHSELLVKETFGVFLMATFGEGEPTDNAQDFYKWIMSPDRNNDISGKLGLMNFAVFALGNRQYEHFCNVGRNLDLKLHQLGAFRLLDHGEGDDDGSLEDDYKLWKKNFWAAATSKFGASANSAPSLFEPAFNINFINDSEDRLYVGGLDNIKTDPKHKSVVAPVLVNKELRQDTSEGNSTTHIDIDLSEVPLEYLTADNLGVYPRNDYKTANLLAKRLGLKPAQLFTLTAVKPNDTDDELHPVPSPCTVEDALVWHADIHCLARASQLDILAQYTNDAEEKDLIKKWQADHDFPKLGLSVYELLCALPHVTLPFNVFLEWCPRLQPRFYTISSSSVVNPKIVSMTVALTIDPKPQNEYVSKFDDRPRVHYGVASSYLTQLKAEGKKDRICVFVRPSSFRLPLLSSPSSNTLPPVIMIGPGTGIAPFRAFVQEFTYLFENKKGPLPISSSLYFGCRHPNQDYLYQSELEYAQKTGSLNELNLAFSRYGDKPKLYVQHLLKQNAKSVWKALNEQGGYVYVCGGTAMGRSIRETITSIAETEGGLSASDAHNYFHHLQESQRYIAELWS